MKTRLTVVHLLWDEHLFYDVRYPIARYDGLIFNCHYSQQHQEIVLLLGTELSC